MARASLLIGAPQARPSSLSLLAKGFRPFFLLAALQAVVTLVLWLGVLRGVVAAPRYLAPVTWHAHEMLLGFTVAVIAGFLLTAVSNWTGRETATGRALAALALLWIAGRVAPWFAADLPRGVPALLDTAFLPALTISLARPLMATGSRRNYVMLAILAVLAVSNVVVHAEALGLVAAGVGRRAHLVCVDAIALMMSVMSGRVIPMFTRNATGVTTIRSNRALELAGSGALAALLVVDAAFPEPSLGSGFIAGLAGILAIARGVTWGTRHALREPLLWILHAGYGWLVAGLVLRGWGDALGLAAGSSATHAITAGAIGSLTLGMMARVSLGHTGRMLVAPRAMALAFLLVSLAAVIRVAAPFVSPDRLVAAWSVAGVCWALAFTIFIVSYAPILMRSRVDGRPG